MTPEALAQEVSSLFSLPEAALRVNELVDDPSASTRDIAAVIRLDAGLAAAVLKLANSAFYGMPSRVDSVDQAIALIGQNALRDLVLATSVVSTFKGIPGELVDMQTFWDNSTTCGVIARNLGQLCGVRESERLFLAGLLHGVGRLVFFARRPEQYREVLQVKDRGEAALVAAERRVFGFGYAELGAALLRLWGLPEMLGTVVAHHLEPGAAPAYRKETAILHVANDMAASLTPKVMSERQAGEYTPAFDEAAFASLGLDSGVLPGVMQSALLQAFEILDIVNPRAALIY